jgi:arginase
MLNGIFALLLQGFYLAKLVKKAIEMSNKVEIIINNSELTAGTRGASLGPFAIMTAARKLGSEFFSKYQQTRLKDYNHLLDTPSYYRKAKNIEGLKEVYLELQQAMSVGSEKKIVLAGDHGSAAGTILGLKTRYPNTKVGVVWIDAHADIHTPYTTPSGNMHGMPLAVAMGVDNLENKHNAIPDDLIAKWDELKALYQGDHLQEDELIYIGVRDTEEEEDAIIESKKLRNITVGELRANRNWEKELEAFCDRMDYIYVSFDVDSMDPSEVSHGTGTPVPNGLHVKEAEELLLRFAHHPKTKCIEFVEVNPCLDEKINTMAEVTFGFLEKVTTAFESK